MGNLPFVFTESYTKLLKEVLPGVGIIWRYCIVKSRVDTIKSSASLLIGENVIGCRERLLNRVHYSLSLTNLDALEMIVFFSIS